MHRTSTVSYDALTGEWKVDDPISWEWSGLPVFIPSGFVCDLASIPRFLWWLPGFAPFELGLDPPIVHDWLYRNGGRLFDYPDRLLTRGESDRVFLDLMTVNGVGWFRRRIAWLAVRLFGRSGWRS